MKPILYGTLFAAWLRFGLEPTAWLFYEISHWFDSTSIYWGYSIFRTSDVYLASTNTHTLMSVIAGALLGALLYWRAARKAA